LEERKLVAPDGAAGDRFGWGVVPYHGEIFASAPWNDEATVDAGALYVFCTPAEYLGKLTASDAGVDDRFGNEISVSGDVAVMGAHWRDELGPDSGAAYVFRKRDGVWREEAKLVPCDGATSDWFGHSVGVDGDVAVISAVYDDDAGADSGSAYVYRYDGRDWNIEAKLIAADGGLGDEFGKRVSISGDLIVVGAWLDDAVGVESGSVYVFRHMGSGWVQEAKLVGSAVGSHDRFGSAVDIDRRMIAVGAYWDDAMGSASGAVYTFRYGALGWVEVGRLAASDGEAGDRLGITVSIDGNVVVAGASWSSDAGYRSGSAYVFRYYPPFWVEEAQLTASDAAAEDRFGKDVSVRGDVIMVGAPYDADEGEATGAAYVFRRVDRVWTEETKLVAPDAAAGDKFGWDVVPHGHAGFVASPLDDEAVDGGGSVYEYLLGGCGRHSAVLERAD
jgi:hypothetical protein